VNLAEVEARIAQLEARVESLRDMAETQSKQIVALRAQLDHYEARQR
jgi:chaperonin cofactor prefoldin